MINWGTVPTGSVLPFHFGSYDGATGASEALTGLAVTDIEIYKAGSVTQRSSDAGYALIDTDGIDIDGMVGANGFTVDTGDNTDAGFYAVGSFFTVWVSAVTIDGVTVNFIAGTFRLSAAEAIAGKPKVDVDAWLGTAAATPTVAGVPEVDLTHVAGSTTSVSALASGVATLLADWLNGGRLDLILDIIAADTTTDIPALIAALDTLIDSIVAAVITNAAGTDIAADIIAIKAETVSILTDTNELQVDDTPGALAALDTLIDSIIAAVITNAAGVDVAADIIALKAETALILADTNELQTDDYPTSIAAVKADTAAILADTGTDGVVVAAASKTGYTLSAAGVQAIWDALTSALTTVGSLGKLIVDNLNATISSRASQTAVDDLPTNAELTTALGTADDAVLAQVALVKAQTDLIPSDPADASVIAGRFDTLDTSIADLPTNAELATSQAAADDATLAAIAALNNLSAAAAADAVWDEAIAGHVGAGSTGESLGAAGAAGDPWTTALPGAYGAGSAGKIVGDNVNATISSRASQTGLDDVPTNAELTTALGTADDAVLAQVALVKAKTDNLPTDPADASVITGRFDTLDTAVADLPTNAELATSQAAADDATLAAIAALNNVSLVAIEGLLDEALADSVPADGSLPSLRQAMYEVRQFLTERAVSGTTLTVKKVDGVTTLETFTLSDATDPVSITRAT